MNSKIYNYQISCDQDYCTKICKIPLTQGKYAIVDGADYEFLMQWKWHIKDDKSGRLYAAAYLGGGRKNVKRGSMHGFIMQSPENKYIDHINGDGLDNRRCNLRFCTNTENQRNSIKRKITTSKYKGVCWSKVSEKWYSSITINYKQINLGFYDSESEAAIAYNIAAKKNFGEFARLNEVEN